MSYIDWNQITEDLDLSFVKPLLDEISGIYQDQWENEGESIFRNDPYASSIREDKLAQVLQNLKSQEAQEKSDLLNQYHQSMLSNSLKNQLESQSENYQQLLEEFEDYKEEQETMQNETAETSANMTGDGAPQWFLDYLDSIQTNQVKPSQGSANSSQTVVNPNNYPLVSTILPPFPTGISQSNQAPSSPYNLTGGFHQSAPSSPYSNIGINQSGSSGLGQASYPQSQNSGNSGGFNPYQSISNAVQSAVGNTGNLFGDQTNSQAFSDVPSMPDYYGKQTLKVQPDRLRRNNIAINGHSAGKRGGATAYAGYKWR